MKTLKTIQTLAKIGEVLSCIAFIFACIGFGGSVVGALSAAFGGGFAIKLGGVTIYDLFGGARYSELEGVCAALLGWMIVCAGEAVVAGLQDGQVAMLETVRYEPGEEEFPRAGTRFVLP